MAFIGVGSSPERRPSLKNAKVLLGLVSRTAKGPSYRMSHLSLQPSRLPSAPNVPLWASLKAGRHGSKIALVPAFLYAGRAPSRGRSGSRPVDLPVFARRRGPWVPRSLRETRNPCGEQSFGAGGRRGVQQRSEGGAEPLGARGGGGRARTGGARPAGRAAAPPTPGLGTQAGGRWPTRRGTWDPDSGSRGHGCWRGRRV